MCACSDYIIKVTICKHIHCICVNNIKKLLDSSNFEANDNEVACLTN